VQSLHASFRTNIAQIPGALVLAFIARFYSGLSGPCFKIFDRHRPRDFVETLKSADLDEEVHLTTFREQDWLIVRANQPLNSGSITAGRSMYSEWFRGSPVVRRCLDGRQFCRRLHVHYR
jgi:hypothetical protein